LKCKPGDEIILPAHTYVATAEVIALLGLIPVFVDVDEHSFNIDTRQIEKKISSRTKAIVPVHLYGQCADMEEILNISKKHNVFVIEDAAQALGAAYTFSNHEKKKAGTMGTNGSTSFFPSKNHGCLGDGGAIFVNDPDLARNIKMIANHGQVVKYHHELVGVNSRLDTLQAAILLVKLKYLDAYEKSRNEVAEFYDRELANVSFLKLPWRSPGSSHVFHQYTVKVSGVNRNELKDYLEKKGIPSAVYYPVPLHLQKAYKRPDSPAGSYLVTEKLSESVLSLPIHTEMDVNQLSYICNTIKEYQNA